MLNIVIAIAGEQFSAEIHGEEHQRNPRLPGEGVHQVRIDKQNVTAADRKSQAIDVCSAPAFREHEQFTFLVPMGADSLCPGRIRGEFVYHKVKTHVAVGDRFMDQIEFLGVHRAASPSFL